MQKLTLGGRERVLALDLNALIALGEHTGKEPFEILKEFVPKKAKKAETSEDGEAKAPDPEEAKAPDPEEAKEAVARSFKLVSRIRTLLWAMLVSDDPSLELDPIAGQREVGKLVTVENMEEVSNAVMVEVALHASKIMEGMKEFDGQMAPFVPTPEPVVEAMIDLAEDLISGGDGLGGHGLAGNYCVDLGAGDGRLLDAAIARNAAGCLGIEKHPERFKALDRKYTGHRNCRVVRADIREFNLNTFDVVFMYLMPAANEELAPKLERELKTGSVVISHDFVFSGMHPVMQRSVTAEDRVHNVYGYRIVNIAK